MSLQLMTEAWLLDIPQGQKMVLLALADRANDDGECWPGQASLSAKCSMSERAIRDNLIRLEEAGLIEIEERFDSSTHARKTNIYRLNLARKMAPNPPADSAGGNRQKATGSHRQIATKPPAESAGYSNEETSVNSFIKDIAPTSCKEASKVARIHPVRLIEGRFEIDPDLYEKFESTYPGVDLEAELGKVELWIESNPSKRKKNLQAFLVNWLSRSQQAIDQATARGKAIRGGR